MCLPGPFRVSGPRNGSVGVLGGEWKGKDPERRRVKERTRTRRKKRVDSAHLVYEGRIRKSTCLHLLYPTTSPLTEEIVVSILTQTFLAKHTTPTAPTTTLRSQDRGCRCNEGNSSLPSTKTSPLESAHLVATEQIDGVDRPSQKVPTSSKGLVLRS